MASSGSPSAVLEEELKDVGNKLLNETSSIVHLLKLLDKAENILFRVEQAPSRSVQDAMLPVMKALMRPELISHSEIDVKASVASCLHELMRITAPDSPYDEKVMEEIFKLTVMLLKKLSLDAGHCYTKAVSILDNMANVRSCLVMLDIEVDELIVEMFQLFFKTIGPHHPVSVFLAMETIMTLVIDEIEEIPLELLTPLLFSMRKENQDVSPLSYKLGESVFKKCATKLKPYLPEGLRLSAFDVNDYAEIVSLTCQDSSERDSIMAPAKELVPDATGHGDDSLFVDGSSKSVINNGSPQVDDTQTPVEINTVKTLQGSASKAGGLRSKGHLYNSNSSTALGEDKSASPSQNHSFLEGSSRKRGRPKKNKDQINLGGDSSKESSGKKKVSFSTSRSQNKDESQSMKSCKANGKRKHSQQKQEMSKKFGEELIGRRIKVWWPMDEMFYEGVIYSYNPAEKKHRVLYADGEEELLNLGNEIWEFAGESNFPDEGKDDASKDCDDRKDDASKDCDDRKVKTTSKSTDKKETKSFDKSKRDKNINCEPGSSDRDKKRKTNRKTPIWEVK